MATKNIFLLLVTIQLVIVVFLTYKIVKNRSNILGASSVNKIDRNSVNLLRIDNLTYFYEPKPGSIDKVNEWSPYKGVSTINSDGLKATKDYTVDKPQGVYRIMTLGDSFTYGLYVDTKDIWPEKLEGLLNERVKCNNINKFEVVNLAVHGYDIQYNVERYKIRGQKYNPDLIIWFIVDPLRITEKMDGLLKQITKKLVMSHETDKINSYYSWGRAYNEVVSQYGASNILTFQKSNLVSLNKMYNGPLFFVFGDWIPGSYKKPFEDYLTTYHKSHWSSTISIPEDNHFPTDGHPNQKGHLEIAKEILQYLTDNKVIPCN